MGRRPGRESTRADILGAAIEVFAERGYEGASLRTITSRAGVDVSLVRHFFGGKEGLFDEAVLAQAEATTRILSGAGDDSLPPAARLADGYLRMWEEPSTGPTFQALFRAALESTRNRDRLQEIMLDRLAEFVRAAVPAGWDLPAEERLARVQLLGAHLMGVGVARYVLRFSPLADMPRERLLADIVATVERYLPDSAGAAGG